MAIAGGSPTLVEQAPWQVTIEATFQTQSSSFESIRCGGAIIDPSHVLTAAHCAFIAPPDEQIPPSDFRVLAGTSSLLSSDAEERNVAVTDVRVHPYYAYTPNSGHTNPDDVAVLTLSEPLLFGPSVSSIALAPLGVYPPEGTSVNFTGFGEQSSTTKELDGKLYSLGMTLEFSRECGGEGGSENAVLLCASSPLGSPCSGDSGSALVMPVPSPALVGVMNDDELIAGKGCVAGAYSSFANVAAPEIQDFIYGSESPPRAPRGGGASCLATTPVVGSTMTCQPGVWSSEPSFTYMFVDGTDGQVLQSSTSPDYQFTSADLGHAVFLRLLASNAGGTGVDRTSPTTPVMPGVTPESQPSVSVGKASLAARNISVSGSGVASLKLDCAGPKSCSGKLILTAKLVTRAKGKKSRSHVITIGTAGFSITVGKAKTVKLALSATGRRLLTSDHQRLFAQLEIVGLEAASKQAPPKRVLLVGERPHRASPGKSR
jgi:hypothetical protein